MRVISGLEAVAGERAGMVRGRRVGLVTHPAAVLPDLTHALEALLRSGARVTALFGPEHGLGGAAAAGDHVGDAVEPRTGIPIYSLYGRALQPDAAMLVGVDLLVCDMQDIGARYYTYIGTLLHVLRGAAAAGVPVLVLDRPNPLGGELIEGPLIAPGYESLVGVAPIPIRHGLTIGEIARLLSATFDLGAELEVAALRGWERRMWLDETGLPWVPTSPNMAHFEAAMLYPGTCLIEGTNLSCGRGTALPFELCGAPWVDGHALAEALNGLALPGVRFRPARFIPTADRFAGQECGGVQAHVTDRKALRPVALGLHLVATLRRLYREEFAWHEPHFDRLIGGPHARAALEAGAAAGEIVAGWEATSAQFAREREPFLLY